MTPESKIKVRIKFVLDEFEEHNIYYYMSVPNGYGKSTLDYLGFIYGQGFAIEAKRPGGKPTRRQVLVIDDIRRSRTPVFVINDDLSLAEFRTWLERVVDIALGR